MTTTRGKNDGSVTWRVAAAATAALVLISLIGITDSARATPDPTASGSTVTAENTSDDKGGEGKNEDGTVTVTASVIIESLDPVGTYWKDIHIIPPRKKALPKLKRPGSGKINVRPGDDPGTPNANEGDTNQDTANDSDDGDAWKYKEGTVEAPSGITIYTDNGGSAPGGLGNSPDATDNPATEDEDESDKDGDGETDKVPYQFELTFRKGTNPDDISNCNWELTDSGEKNDSSPIEDDGPASGVSLPVAQCTINNDDPVSVNTNVTTSISVLSETWLAGSPYKVYTSHSLNPDFNDEFEIGINSEVDPIPPAWGITLSGEDGVLNGNGELPGAGFQVTVPNSPSLVGEEFYAVFAIDNSDGEILYASSPVKITITAP